MLISYSIDLVDPFSKVKPLLKIKNDEVLMLMHDLYKFENGSDREMKRMK